MAKDLKKFVDTISILNKDEEESTLTPRQLMWNYDESDDKSYIISDADHELLILVNFKTQIHLKSITIKSIAKINNDNVSSSPKQIHIYSMQHLNINFDDLKQLNPDKSIKCSTKKLKKGQKIMLNKTSKNVLTFKHVLCIAIFIESNQNNTELTHLNGIKFHGDVLFEAKGINPSSLAFHDRTEMNNKLDGFRHEKAFKFPDVTADKNNLMQSDSLLSTKYVICKHSICYHLFLLFSQITYQQTFG